MSSCLGLYIEEHLIKYAKVTKERDNIKVESFGVKFFDKLGDAITQVIEETYSQKTPISVNLSDEMYNYFDMFALLTKNDLQRAIKTEFESYCADKGYNPNVFETRYSIVDSQLDKDKIKIIHIADNKIELNKRLQEIEGYHLINISPVSMSIPNLIKVRKDVTIDVIAFNIDDEDDLDQLECTSLVTSGKFYNAKTAAQLARSLNSSVNTYKKVEAKIIANP